MKLQLITVFILLFCFTQAQNSKKFNLDFETQKFTSELSDGWFQWGSYPLSIDSLSYSGDKSGKITGDGSGSGFGSIAYKIPANFEGKTIELKGYMKTKNVEDGFAGLLLRVDGKSGSLVFDNMEKQQITGTNDWKQYTISLDYPNEGKKHLCCRNPLWKG